MLHLIIIPCRTILLSLCWWRRAVAVAVGVAGPGVVGALRHPHYAPVDVALPGLAVVAGGGAHLRVLAGLQGRGGRLKDLRSEWTLQFIKPCLTPAS